MSWLGMPCSVPGCDYTTVTQAPANTPLADKITLLQIHQQSVHPGPLFEGKEADAKSLLEIVPRPSIKTGLGPDEFQVFISMWKAYKRSCHMTNPVEIRDQLLACCDLHLRMDLHRALGTSLEAASEEDILELLERLSVLPGSKLTNMVNLISADQGKGESVRAYLARLKVLASSCKLTVDCPAAGCTSRMTFSNQVMLYTMVKGLADTEVKKEILSKYSDMSLEATVDFVEANEKKRFKEDEQKTDEKEVKEDKVEFRNIKVNENVEYNENKENQQYLEEKTSKLENKEKEKISNFKEKEKKPSENSSKRCPKNHELRKVSTNTRKTWKCDSNLRGCYCYPKFGFYPNVGRYRCDICDFDVCEDCYNNFNQILLLPQTDFCETP